MPQLTEDEFRSKVSSYVAQGGWSTISSLVDMIPIEDLRDQYYWLDEEDDDDDDDDE